MKLVSSQEVIAFHDRLVQAYGGLAGMADPWRAEAIIHRVLNMHHYSGVDDIYELAAIYLVAVSRGHIFNDGNKRTALFTTQVFLKRNGIHLQQNITEVLIDITLKAATGALPPQQLAQRLRDVSTPQQP